MRQFTNGEMSTYDDCKRKWWLAWYRKLRSKAPDGLVSAAGLGSLVHKPLATHYDPDDAHNPFVVLEHHITNNRAEIEQAMGEQRVSQDVLVKHEKNAALARVMLEGYFQWLQETGADQGLKIVAAEAKVSVPVPGLPDAELMGKLDLRVLRELDDAILFLDHKTVGSLAAAMQMLHMNRQMKHYYLIEYLLEVEAAKREGREPRIVEGAIYNMLRKVKRTASATPPFYDRVEVRFNRHELTSYFKQAWGWMHEILRTEARLAAGADPLEVVPANPSRDCTWKCEFFPVCPMFDDGSRAEDMLVEYYVVGNPLDRYEDEDVEDE